MSPLLEVERLEAGYGDTAVLFGVGFTVGQGEVATLLGRNGMGKTTTIRALMGLIPLRGGTIRFDGQSLAGAPAHRIARAGLGLAPEGRQIFPNLTVRENLVATAKNRTRRDDPWTLDRVIDLFPSLSARAGHYGDQLSGGEQQMLAIGRALMTNPRLLILDEATEGLAPLVRQEIWSCIARLREDGQSILLIDKNLDALLDLADSHTILEKGRVVWSGPTTAFRAEPDLHHHYLGV